jgi:hypothetical protein
LATLDPGEGIADVQAALADGFDFGSPEFHARFVAFEDLIIPERFSVGGDFVRHTAAGLRGPPVWEDWLLLSDVLDLDLAVDDLKQSDVSVTETWTALDERGSATGELFDALRDHVDQDGRIFDDLGGLFDKFGFHRL